MHFTICMNSTTFFQLNACSFSNTSAIFVIKQSFFLWSNFWGNLGIIFYCEGILSFSEFAHEQQPRHIFATFKELNTIYYTSQHDFFLFIRRQFIGLGRRSRAGCPCREQDFPLGCLYVMTVQVLLSCMQNLRLNFRKPWISASAVSVFKVSYCMSRLQDQNVTNTTCWTDYMTGNLKETLQTSIIFDQLSSFL